MPVYAFDCAGCGEFEQLRPVADAAAPAHCPDCGTQGRRVFSAPALARLGRPLRRALDREEASAHEPAVVATKQGAPMPHLHRGHACCSR